MVYLSCKAFESLSATTGKSQYANSINHRANNEPCLIVIITTQEGCDEYHKQQQLRQSAIKSTLAAHTPRTTTWANAIQKNYEPFLQ